ncbi:Mak10 domain-containing protein [Phanerochaete sordida]|uniref:Mak10 domain-containing protein n=1 Tax=Phanerochaete sordida TaxID=48140 RepID=A0A9P3G2X9_9APHY|nr:Mak10 domain-containing protein [Phanerochaete sordida]
MLDDMDVDTSMGLPGGDMFEDVTELFQTAAKEMNIEEVILTPGFTLMDSMSAFEIGEPRMDSGMLQEQDNARPPFESLSPLLPEELCWIIDRSFAGEMGWYAGNMLSQTVYTLLYVHTLQDINPDVLPPQYFHSEDSTRPMQLLTSVLRPAVFAMLKNCDIVWRELSKKRVHDMEDWQSEKCEVSLLEGVPVDFIVHKLDEAYIWLRDSDLPQRWIDGLADRLALRKTLLQLFHAGHTGNLEDLKPLVAVARSTLQRVRTQPTETPPPDSPAIAAFDPHISRRLHTIMPTRELELPSQDTVWDDLERMLDGWENVDHLRENHTLLAWQVNGSLRVWLPSKPLLMPYHRSLTQHVFIDNHIVLGDYGEDWLVEQFFWETIGVSYESICEILINSWAGPGALALQEMESHIIETVSAYIRSFWFNPPRRRRHLMKAVNDWQLLQDAFGNLLQHIAAAGGPINPVLHTLPHVAALWKFTTAREVIIAGFQQELYAAYERPLAYWYIVHILESQLETLDHVKHIIPTGSFARHELDYQVQFLSVLQLICSSLFVMTSKEKQPDAERVSLNFKRRYKWLCSPREDNPEALLFELPLLEDFHRDVQDVKEAGISAEGNLRIAEDALVHLPSFVPRAHTADNEYDGRIELIECLARINKELLDFVAGDRTENAKLHWDPRSHPWFPIVVTS